MIWIIPTAWPAITPPRAAVLERNLRRDRMTRGEVEAEMRLAGIAHLEDVAWAILETNGKISFICRDAARHARQPEEAGAAG